MQRTENNAAESALDLAVVMPVYNEAARIAAVTTPEQANERT
jgi:hypothetical protein